MVPGTFYDALRSTPVAATLDADSAGNWVLRFGAEQLQLDPRRVEVSDRIGSIPRRVRLDSGAEFETRDNDGVDALLNSATGQRAARHVAPVDGMERRWSFAVAALVAVVASSYLLLKFGLPAMSAWAANRLPPAADRLIGVQTLQILDRSLLDPSQLHAQRQAQLANMFRRMTADLHDGHEYRLEFRGGKRLGPNAFALPAGIIVMTDELVALAGHDEELMAVLAHEVGHVRGRHALRQLIQGAGISTLAVVVLGDVSSVTAIASAAPALLQAKNSRDLEREADSFARDWLARQDISATRFDDILCRMTERYRKREGGAMQFMASHPPTEERVVCRPTTSPPRP
jgi:Zn-dependent protease with chaperone function